MLGEIKASSCLDKDLFEKLIEKLSLVLMEKIKDAKGEAIRLAKLEKLDEVEG